MSNAENRSVVWTWVVRLAVTAVAVMVLGWLFSRLSEVLIMLAVAALLAFILDPLVNRLARRMPRGAAIAVAYLGLVALLAVALVMVVPQILDQLRNLEQAVRRGDYTNQWQQMSGQVGAWYDRIPDPVRDQMAQIKATAEEVGKKVAGTFFTALLGVLGWMGKGMIILVLSIYLLLDKRLIRDSLLSLVPLSMRSETVVIVGEVLEVIRAYLRGQIFVIGFVAVAVTVVLAFMGIPYALTIGTLAGILEVIPYFGSVCGAIPAVVLAFLNYGTVSAGIVIAFFIVINQIEGHVVIPWVMGRTLEMRPFAVLLSLLVGAELYGIVGLIVAVPVCRILQVLVEHGVRLYREARRSESDVVAMEATAAAVGSPALAAALEAPAAESGAA